MYACHKNVYQNKTLVGNWQEDRVKQEDDEKNSDKIGAKLLKEYELKQRLLLKPMKLSNCSNGIKYGDLLMFVNIATKSPLSTDSMEKVYINDDEYRMATTSPIHKEPCTRNTFIIIPINKNNKFGDNVKYGEYFMLKMNDELCTNDNEWYLMTQIMSHLSSANYTRQQCVLFTNKIQNGCKWYIKYGDSTLIIENEGNDVNCNTPVSVSNVFTNQLLASDLVTQGTDFGNEYEVTCNTFQPKGSYQTLKKEVDGFGAESRGQLNQNKWIIVDINGIPKEQ